MILTKKAQFGKNCHDGKSRNFMIYFLNNIEILRLKIPFSNDYDKGFDRKTIFTDEHILNNRLYITKKKFICYQNDLPIYKERLVSYPISKLKLQQALKNDKQ